MVYSCGVNSHHSLSPPANENEAQKENATLSESTRGYQLRPGNSGVGVPGDSCHSRHRQCAPNTCEERILFAGVLAADYLGSQGDDRSATLSPVRTRWRC